MIKLLEEIDELLAFLEDTAHGEEGKRITEMRYKILTEIDFLTQEQRTECSCPDDSDSKILMNLNNNSNYESRCNPQHNDYSLQYYR